jgi:hypothetical protein
MRVAKSLCGAAMALALVLTLTAVKPAKANDSDVPDGRVAVTYEVQLDWLYPATGQTFHNGYTITVYYDNGTVVQMQGYDEAAADIASSESAGWTVTNVAGPNVVGTTPW